MDTGSFKRALRRVLRQDPDVILIGEMRDEETVHTALSAAETGHLVFSTVHTVDAAETVNRLIDFFPPHMHKQVRAMIAGDAQGRRVAAPRPDDGRQRPHRLLRGPADDRPRARHDHQPDETGRLPEVIAEGSFYGMQTFDQHLFEHLKAGRVEMDRPRPGRDEPARLQAPRRRRRQARHDDGRPHRRRDAPHADGGLRVPTAAMWPPEAGPCCRRPHAPGR